MNGEAPANVIVTTPNVNNSLLGFVGTLGFLVHILIRVIVDRGKIGQVIQNICMFHISTTFPLSMTPGVTLAQGVKLRDKSQ